MEAPNQEEEKIKENKTEEEQQLITDFSAMFKGKGTFRKMPKLSSKKVEQIPNWLLEIPAKIELTKEELSQRRILDQKRWHSIAKTSDQKHHLVAAAISAWNYLFSSKGMGSIPPLTVKFAVEILQKNQIIFQTKEENLKSELTISIFEFLCSEFKVKAQGKILYKPTQPKKVDNNEENCLKEILLGLQTQEKSYVLITSNMILCPIGFDNTPLKPLDAYKKLEDIKKEDLELWIINASVQRISPSFVIKRWKHVEECLQTVWPNYLDLNEAKSEPIRHPNATPENQTDGRGSPCCLLEWSKVKQ